MVLALSTAAIGLLRGSTISALVAMAVFGASYMTLTIVVFFAALRLSPTRPAATVGLGFLMITLGQAVGAPLAGLLIDHTGATNACLAFTLIGALATFLSPTMERRRGRLRPRLPGRHPTGDEIQPRAASTLIPRKGRETP